MPRIALFSALCTLSIAGAALAGPIAGGLPGPVVVSPPTSAPQGVLGYRQPEMPTRAPLFAIVGNRLLVGESRPDPIGGGGTLALKDESQPEFTCAGAYREVGRPAPWSQKASAAARFECSDGSQFQVAYEGTPGDGRCGFAYARTVSLCYGFAARAAAHRLAPPPGYVLILQHGRLSMKPSGV